MQFKPIQRTPVLLAVAILLCVCVVRLLRLDFFDRLERVTYDLRAQTALHFPAPVATNLAFVAIEDSSITAVQSGRLGYRYGLYWPRQVYGRLVEELSAQGAKAVAFDVLFGELRPDHPLVQMADGNLIESDDFFALQMPAAGNVILAITPELIPPDLFATNALALGGHLDRKGFRRHAPPRRRLFNLSSLASALRKQQPTRIRRRPATRRGLKPDKIILPQTGSDQRHQRSGGRGK